MTIKQFCEQTYETLFNEEYDSSVKKFHESLLGKKKKSPAVIVKTKEDIAIQARKYAIQETVYLALEKFPSAEPSEIWKNIYVAHVSHRSGETDLEKISKIITADQSWKKSSGHAFESMIKNMSNPLLKDFSLHVFLQKDLHALILKDKISNPERDVLFFKQIIGKDIFDLFIGFNDDDDDDDKFKIFGVIQSKTSIRDRVTRDREPSINAMEHYFLSIAIALDGAFLKLPKFKSMVNGNTDEHVVNGWHAMYVFSNDESFVGDRIFIFDMKMEVFVGHMKKAAEFWKSDRQWFDKTWNPAT